MKKILIAACFIAAGWYLIIFALSLNFDLPREIEIFEFLPASTRYGADFNRVKMWVAIGLLALVKKSLFGGALAGFIMPVFTHELDQEHKWRSRFFGFIVFAGALPLVSWAIIEWLTDASISGFWPLLWLGSVAGGFVGVMTTGRTYTSVTQFFWHKFKKRTGYERNRKTDIREIEKFLPTPAPAFDPRAYFDGKKGIFVGKGEDGKPVYLAWPKSGSVRHAVCSGSTGTGKGIGITVMATQFLQLGEALFYFDPKDDEWSPHALFQECQRLNVPFHIINLNPRFPAQVNPVAGADEFEIHELFISALGLIQKGSESDFYGIDDRRAAKTAANFIAENKITFAGAWSSIGDDLEGQAKKFGGYLQELAELAPINAREGGVDLQKIMDGGGCVYVIGSDTHDTVKTAQRLLFTRLIQLAKKRDRIAGSPRRVCVVLDEFIHHISRISLQSLALVRDKGMHLLLAHQAITDFRLGPADLDPEGVKGAVVENCKVFLTYQLQDPDTAEWVGRRTGEIQVDDETRRVETNAVMAEVIESERSIKQTGRNFFDINTLTNLPPRVAVFRDDGLAQFVTIHPIPTIKSHDAIKIVGVPGDVPDAPAGKIAVEDDTKSSPPRSRNRSSKGTADDAGPSLKIKVD